MQKYNKAIVAIVTALVTGVSIFYNSPDWLQMLVPVLGALGVYQVTNEVK